MRKKEPKRWGVILVTVFIALSMILSIFAIVLDNQGNSLKYNGYKFVLANDGYKVKVNDKMLTFRSYPATLENFNLSQDTKDLLSNSKAIAILFNPNSTIEDLSYTDYARFSFDEKIDTPVYFAVTQESDTYLLPILTCDNATTEIPFILLNISSDASIVQEGNCIILNAKLLQIFDVEERIAYQMLGIMK